MIPIVVIAYNRPRSLARLLSSLKKARYPDTVVPLIISIDKGDNNEEVIDISKNYQWEHGEKIVRCQKKNLGLRQHVLQCGDLALEYGKVILLEDDLYVSPEFYMFSIQALEFSESQEYIAGVSLYNHRLNVLNSFDFSPVEDGFDNWYFQFASSWGQAWSKTQWEGFKAWYATNPRLSSMERIPKAVKAWSDKSWLKYFIAYLVETDKYFLYPRISLTTNFSDPGTHVGMDSTDYQVPLLFSTERTYVFSDIEASQAVYDAYFENKKLVNVLEIYCKDVCIDLYGSKSLTPELYFLTSRKLDLKLIKSYGRSLKPHDANIFAGIEGTDFYLYKKSEREPNPYKVNNLRRVRYYHKAPTFYSIRYLVVDVGRKYFKIIKNKVIRIIRP